MKAKYLIGVAICLALTAQACIRTNTSPDQPTTPREVDGIKTMTIESSAFKASESIPSKYTCEGDNINMPLQFSDVPVNAQSLVLLMDDPDVPKNLKPDGVFDHWVIYNMPPTATGIAENSTPPGMQGNNGAGTAKYTGPCPPDREHRYFFKLYALDSMLQFGHPPTKSEVQQAMQGHIVAQTELIGKYEKQKK